MTTIATRGSSLWFFIAFSCFPACANVRVEVRKLYRLRLAPGPRPLECRAVSEFLESLEPVGFDALYGLELLEVTAEVGRAQVKVGPEHLQPFGLVHGGVYAAISESIASICTAVAVVPDGKVASGISPSTYRTFAGWSAFQPSASLPHATA